MVNLCKVCKYRKTDISFGTKCMDMRPVEVSEKLAKESTKCEILSYVKYHKGIIILVCNYLLEGGSSPVTGLYLFST